MRTPTHEDVSPVRPGPAMDETLCRSSLLAHRLVSTNSNNAPTFLLGVTFKDEPKVLQCFFSSLIFNDGVVTADTITPEVCRLMTAREHSGQHHCLPTSWFLEIFCTLLCTGTFLFIIEHKCQPAEEICQYRF